MKSLLILVLLLLLSRCNNPKTLLSFNSIDYSAYWGSYTSIKILNTGNAYFYYTDCNDNAYYYSLELSKNQLDSLSEMVETLYSIKIDTIYMLERDSGRNFSLLINSAKGRLMTTYSGPYMGVEGLKPLYGFIDYLVHVSENKRESVDSNFVFETSNKLKRIMPPLPDIERFK
jgi:hypothetical protein